MNRRKSNSVGELVVFGGVGIPALLLATFIFAVVSLGYFGYRILVSGTKGRTVEPVVLGTDGQSAG